MFIRGHAYSAGRTETSGRHRGSGVHAKYARVLARKRVARLVRRRRRRHLDSQHYLERINIIILLL